MPAAAGPTTLPSTSRAIATAGSQRPAEGSAWQLRLLGRPVLAVAERECSIALRPKDAALLAVVALSGPFQSAHLAAMLWPTATARQADTSLRQRLFRVRREAGQALVTSGTLMTLAPGLDLDLGATLEQIRVDEHAGRDELLGDLDFDDLPELAAWVGVQRQEWREQRDAALAAAVAQCEKTVAVSGAVYRVANPTLLPPSLTLAARVGDAAPVAALAVTNASPDAFTERLDASFGAVSGGFVGAGSITGLVAGASSNALSVSLKTASAGGFTGNAGVSFVSSGAGTTGAADLALPGQAVALTGHVYTPGAAQLNTAVVDFGILHRGDTVAERVVSVTTSAPVSAANDTLRASLGAAPTGFTSGGTLAGLAAGATDATSLRIGVNSAAAGTFAGSVTATFASHDNELADLALGSATIALKGQVNNFAEASLVKSGAGTLTHQGDTYTIDFGTLMLGAGVQSASLSVLNGAIGPSDLLSGAFDLSGATAGFTLSGFASFANLAAGSTFDGLGVRFDDEAQGTFLATVVLHAAGSNASGYAGALGDTFLVLRGDVAVAAVPEPETYVLMLAGLLVVARVAQRRRQRSSAPDAR